MALTACRECGESISTGAAACPKCGARRTSTLTKLVLGFIIMSVVAGAVGSMLASKQREEARAREAARVAALTPEQRQAEARAKAEAAARDAEREKAFQRALAVARALKSGANDPNSIQFEEALVTDAGTVAMRYRGRNAFGALVVNYAVVTPDGKSATGATRSDIAVKWNKYIAKRDVHDVSRAIKGAQDMGSL